MVGWVISDMVLMWMDGVVVVGSRGRMMELEREEDGRGRDDIPLLVDAGRRR